MGKCVDGPFSGKKLRLMIGAYINLNVIDGSAFFVSGLAAMCAQNPFAEIFVVSAVPITRFEVVDELRAFPNVEVIDPYIANPYVRIDGEANSMKKEEYARVLASATDVLEPDAIIIRDTKTAAEFVALRPSDAGRLATYVTGLTSLETSPDPDLVKDLYSLAHSGSKFLCQTESIVSILQNTVESLDASRVGMLPPHVPSARRTLGELRSGISDLGRFVYTGKFFDAWNTDKIFASFKALNQAGAKLRLDVAGDQFRKSEVDPYFVANTSYLLETTPGLEWHGRVPRSQSRSLISGASTGIGWRSAALDYSAEFSTKILEYGSLGRPTITNPTPVNRSVLGEDYPLYAGSISDFKKILIQAANDEALVNDAAAACFEVSKSYTYDAVRPKLVEFLVGRSFGDSTYSIPLSEIEKFLLEHPEVRKRTADVEIAGEYVKVWLNDDSDNSLEFELSRIQSYLHLWKSFVSQRFGVVLEEKDPQRTAQTTVQISKSVPNELLSTRDQLKQSEASRQQLLGELDSTKRRLEALKGSQLGSLQVEIWNARKGPDPLRHLSKVAATRGIDAVKSRSKRLVDSFSISNSISNRKSRK